MTDDKGRQEKERLEAIETKEGPLKEMVAVGIGLGPQGKRYQWKAALHSENLLAGRGAQRHPIVELGYNETQPCPAPG